MEHEDSSSPGFGIQQPPQPPDPYNQFVTVRLVICGADLHFTSCIVHNLQSRSRIFCLWQGTVHLFEMRNAIRTNFPTKGSANLTWQINVRARLGKRRIDDVLSSGGRIVRRAGWNRWRKVSGGKLRQESARMRGKLFSGNFLLSLPTFGHKYLDFLPLTFVKYASSLCVEKIQILLKVSYLLVQLLLEVKLFA